MHGSDVGEERYWGGGEIWCAEGYGACMLDQSRIDWSAGRERQIVSRCDGKRTVLVSQIYDSVVNILRHGVARAQFRPLFRDECPGRRVRVLQKAGIPNTREKPVIGQEFEPRGIDVCVEAMELDAVLVVYEDVLFLCDGDVGLVVEIAGFVGKLDGRC